TFGSLSPAVGTQTNSASGPPARAMKRLTISGPTVPPPTITRLPRAGPKEAAVAADRRNTERMRARFIVVRISHYRTRVRRARPFKSNAQCGTQVACEARHGTQVRVSLFALAPGLHHPRDRDSGFGNRRQHRHFQRGERGAAA